MWFFSTARKLPRIWEVIQPTVDSCLNVKRQKRLQDLTGAHTSFLILSAWPKIADSFQRLSLQSLKILLLPARLNFKCCLSSPIWIHQSKAQPSEMFIQKHVSIDHVSKVSKDRTELIGRMTRRAIQSFVGD